MVQELVVLSCCYNKFYSLTPISAFLFQWISLCVNIDIISKNFLLIQDGKIIRINNLANSTDIGANLNGGGYLYFGQDLNTFNFNFNPQKSYSGEFSNLFMFNETLSVKEMIDFTLCKNRLQKVSFINFLNIEKDFDIHETDIVNYNSINFCNTQKHYYKLFPELKSFNEAKSFCHSVGGELIQPENENENAILFEICNSSYICNHKTTYYNDVLWLGVNFDIKKKKWYNYLTKYPINFSNFAETEIVNLNTENRCASFYGCGKTFKSWIGKWFIKNCNDLKKTACVFNQLPILRLRGLCKKSLFDRAYTFSPNVNDITFRGIYFSRISRSKLLNNDAYSPWIISRNDKPDLIATTENLSVLHYPIGKSEWKVQNDACNINRMELKLTICHEGEFSCSDGSCIKLKFRCDLSYQCEDGSDENDCYPLVLPPKYSADISPPAIDEKPTNDISFLIYILNILKFDTAQSQVSLELYLKSSWFDSRLNFKNLKPNVHENIVEDLGSLIWKPNFIFQGASNTSCTLIRMKSQFSIERRTDPLPDNDEILSEGIKYIQISKIQFCFYF